VSAVADMKPNESFTALSRDVSGAKIRINSTFTTLNFKKSFYFIYWLDMTTFAALN
jgi:hypothetical protein